MDQSPEQFGVWMLGAETVPRRPLFLHAFSLFRAARDGWPNAVARKKPLRVLRRVLDDQQAEESLREIKETSGQRRCKNEPQLASLFSRKMSFIMFIALGLGFFQQITGINAVLFLRADHF
jgi:hypothetical protein